MLAAVNDQPRRLDLVGIREIAKMLGVSRQRVQQIVNRPDFPEPVADLAIKVWDGAEVREWIRERRPHLKLEEKQEE